MLIEKLLCTTTEKYLIHRKYSIGVPFVCSLYFAFCKYPDFYSKICHMESAGEIIGMINDLGTYNREDKENKINLIKILRYEGLNKNDAICKVEKMIDDRTLLLRQSENNYYINFFLRIIDITAAFYKKYSFENFTRT